MLFNSYVFLGCFLPITLVVYYSIDRLSTRRTAASFLVLASLIFYGYWDWRFLPLILGSIAFNYAISRLVVASAGSAPLVVGIATNLLVLGIFKYALFFLEVGGLAETAPDFLRNLVLPLGISFWTFQQIAYLVDVRKGRARPAPVDAHAFSMLFFPHLIAGPILLYRNISGQYLRERWPQRYLWLSFQAGLVIFAIGLFKKVCVADTLAPFADMVFDRAGSGEIATIDAFVGAAAYSLQLYFDFSGYSDMAFGLARMFGFRIPINFWSPYQAVSIVDFWRRWHRSLTDFFRTYVYIPLGGNRRGLPRQVFNTLFVFLLTGIWHGAGWTFIVWGGVHGLLLVFARLWRVGTARFPIQAVVPGWLRVTLSRVATLVAVVLLWVLFRSADFETAMRIYDAMLGPGYGFSAVLNDTAFLDWGAAVLAAAGLYALFGPNTFVISRFVRRLAASSGRAPAWAWPAGAIVTGACLYLGIASLSRTEAIFLYYNF
jgi:D-alanyl-lipoteichoic acid acyltransferase DltB (MBOAT superfamily)